MSDVIEVVLESVNFNKVIVFLKMILSDNAFDDAVVINGTERKYNDFELFYADLLNLEKSNIFINLKKLISKDIEVDSPSINIRFSEDKYDLIFIFEIPKISVRNNNLVLSLLEFAKNSAIELSALVFYSGLEPAEDLDTRIFTNTTLGPIKIL